MRVRSCSFALLLVLWGCSGLETDKGPLSVSDPPNEVESGCSGCSLLPEVLSATQGAHGDKVVVSWQLTSGTQSTSVWREVDDGGLTEPNKLADLLANDLSFSDATTTPGINYRYFVLVTESSSGLVGGMGQGTLGWATQPCSASALLASPNTGGFTSVSGSLAGEGLLEWTSDCEGSSEFDWAHYKLSTPDTRFGNPRCPDPDTSGLYTVVEGITTSCTAGSCNAVVSTGVAGHYCLAVRGAIGATKEPFAPPQEANLNTSFLFDDWEEGTTNWVIQVGTGDVTGIQWNLFSDIPYSGGNYIRIADTTTGLYGNSQNAWLVTASPFSLAGASAPGLLVPMLIERAANELEDVIVGVSSSSNGGHTGDCTTASYSATWTLLNNTDATAPTLDIAYPNWEYRHVDLSAWAGDSSLCIAFIFQSSATSLLGKGWALDNVQIVEMTPPSTLFLEQVPYDGISCSLTNAWSVSNNTATPNTSAYLVNRTGATNHSSPCTLQETNPYFTDTAGTPPWSYDQSSYVWLFPTASSDLTAPGWFPLDWVSMVDVDASDSAQLLVRWSDVPETSCGGTFFLVGVNYAGSATMAGGAFINRHQDLSFLEGKHVCYAWRLLDSSADLLMGEGWALDDIQLSVRSDS